MTSSNFNVVPKTEPWYRNHMVLLMLGLPAIVVVASFITLFIAIKTNDGVVTDDYYKQGLAINQDLARDEKAKAMGLAGQMSVVGTTVELKLTSTARAVLLGQPIQLSMQNMASKTDDRLIALVPAGDDVWRGQLKQELTSGHWQVQLEGQDWRLMQTVIGDAKAPVVFKAH